MVRILNLLVVISRLGFTYGQEVPNNHSKRDEYMFAEDDLANYNMFKSIGIWIPKVASDSMFETTHWTMTLNENKVFSFSYNGDKLVGLFEMSHIQDSKALDVRGNSKGYQVSNTLVFLHQDEDILAALWIFGHGMRNQLTISVRVGAHVENESIQKLIFDKFMTNPNTRRLIDDLIPDLKWINQYPVKLIPGTEDVPINYDDLIDADITGAVGNWSIKASTFKGQVFQDIQRFEITLEENKEIVTLFQGEKIIGMGELGYIKGTKLWLLDLYLTYTRKYFPIQFMLVYVDRNINISVQKLKSKDLHLTVLARTGVPFPKEYVKQLISDHVLFNPDIKRSINEILPDLTFF